MASLNKVMLIGNLTRDPEVKYTPKGTAVAEIAIAINRNYTGADGQKKEEVTFIDVTLWERLAEIAGEYLKKGRPVFIEGRLQLDTWDDKATGQKRSRLRVRAEQMQLLGSREGGGGPQGAPRDEDEGGSSRPAPRPAQQRPAPGRPKPAESEEEADDIPF
jgi:single-strand DNA-binding protein